MKSEDELVAEFKAAHADTVRLDEELAAARRRRRGAGEKLKKLGRGTSWMARLIGVTPQAVDGFLTYHQRRARKTHEA
ncbi:LuxR family transcriptional regulator [Nocardia sp. NPDC049220]|uniref:LuxR family transcriptional regulator n=1 Tax=Nocardia sp. NPDC049220 TaxID=3155273 RepID=UPI0033C8DF94